MEPIRLVRYLAQCGVASRRGAGDFVQAGRVAVNGAVTDNMALGIGPDDTVTVDGRVVRPPEAASVWVLNKPAGVVCSRRDPHNPRTVLDSLPPAERRRLVPVGRLDKDTTGLLLLTDDGELMQRLTHPSHGIDKTYRITVGGLVSDESLGKLRAGIELDDGITAAARARIVTRHAEKTILNLTIHEGRNRQVKRMCDAIGHSLRVLERVAYGPLRLDALGDLARGQARPLTPGELLALRREAGLVEDDGPRKREADRNADRKADRDAGDDAS
jgi:23S rRNA pseudouridine2605 synthase